MSAVREFWRTTRFRVATWFSAHDLGRRVPVPGNADEISRLAETMNTMLARLDTAVARQSQFTADASHELMGNQVEVLLTYPDDIAWRPSSENVLLDVTRMEELVADLLLLSKLEGAETGPLTPCRWRRLSTPVSPGASRAKAC